jgi:hypothetical protein
MDTNSTLLIAGICIVIGLLIGGMLSSLRKEPESDSSGEDRSPVLKIWQSLQNRSWIIELDGHEYDRSAQLTTNQRNLINQVILKLNDWLAYIPPQKQPETPETSTAATTPEAMDPAATKARFSLNPVNVLTNALKADVSLSQLPSESIVSQIDDILQEKLRNSPLSGEPIRLMEWPNKGMVVMVGLNQYDSVDQVPDERIRRLIRSAVSEWEQTGAENA